MDLLLRDSRRSSQEYGRNHEGSSFQPHSQAPRAEAPMIKSPSGTVMPLAACVAPTRAMISAVVSVGCTGTWAFNSSRNWRRIRLRSAEFARWIPCASSATVSALTMIGTSPVEERMLLIKSGVFNPARSAATRTLESKTNPRTGGSMVRGAPRCLLPRPGRNGHR